MEKISERLYKLSSGHIFNVRIPPIPKVFKMVSLIGKALKEVDVESMIKKFFEGNKDLENFDIANIDVNAIRDIFSFIMEQEELFNCIYENMKTSLIDDNPCDFELDNYKEDLLECMFLYVKEAIYPFIKTPISKLLSQLGDQGNQK